MASRLVLLQRLGRNQRLRGLAWPPAAASSSTGSRLVLQLHTSTPGIAQPPQPGTYAVGEVPDIPSDAWAEAAQEEKKKKEEDRKTADEEEAIKIKILNAAMPHVHKHGWTRLAIAAGAESAGYLSVVSGLFPSEGLDLVLHHVRQSNRQLDAWMEAETRGYRETGQKLPVGKFIRSALERRLRMNAEFVKSKRWGEAMAMLANPLNSLEALGCIQELSDDIWHRAGDTAHDMSWYSKRISLAAIYAATEVFMLQDSSPDFHDTWKFLDRRFEDLNQLPQIATLPQDVGGLLSGLATTARNMAGLQSDR